VRKRSFGWVKGRIDQEKIENTTWYDIVDGKQRSSTILEFIQDKLEVDGIYYDDLSVYAKVRFRNYNKLSYAEIDDNCTDEEVLKYFVSINDTGVPVSKEHLEKVKSII
jgi:uncharacterized protein with ParB-like and HNH nuclease domain